MKSDLNYKKIQEIRFEDFSDESFEILVSMHPYEIIKIIEPQNEKGNSEPFEDWNPEVLDMLNRYFGVSKKEFNSMSSSERGGLLVHLTRLLYSDCDLNKVNKTNVYNYSKEGFVGLKNRYLEIKEEIG